MLTIVLIVAMMVMLMSTIERTVGLIVAYAIDCITGLIHYVFTVLMVFFSKGYTFLIGREMSQEGFVHTLMNFGFEGIRNGNAIRIEIEDIALVILVTIASWQIFKAFFGFLGLNQEIEEPWKVGLKALFFGFFVYYIRDICWFIIDGPVTAIRNYILSVELGVESGKIVSRVAESVNTDNLMDNVLGNVGIGEYMSSFTGNSISLALFKAVVIIYVDYKMFSFMLTIIQKYVNVIFYIMLAPLAVACGVAKATSDVLKSWVKLFAGGISIQMIQIILLKLITVYGRRLGESNSKNWSLVFVYLAVAFVMDKSEEILEEFGLSGGIKFNLGMESTKNIFLKLF